jgi:hypothetical protein
MSAALASASPQITVGQFGERIKASKTSAKTNFSINASGPPGAYIWLQPCLHEQASSGMIISKAVKTHPVLEFESDYIQIPDAGSGQETASVVIPGKIPSDAVAGCVFVQGITAEGIQAQKQGKAAQKRSSSEGEYSMQLAMATRYDVVLVHELERKPGTIDAEVFLGPSRAKDGVPSLASLAATMTSSIKASIRVTELLAIVRNHSGKLVETVVMKPESVLGRPGAIRQPLLPDSPVTFWGGITPHRYHPGTYSVQLSARLEGDVQKITKAKLVVTDQQLSELRTAVQLVSIAIMIPTKGGEHKVFRDNESTPLQIAVNKRGRGRAEITLINNTREAVTASFKAATEPESGSNPDQLRITLSKDQLTLRPGQKRRVVVRTKASPNNGTQHKATVLVVVRGHDDSVLYQASLAVQLTDKESR